MPRAGCAAAVALVLAVPGLVHAAGDPGSPRQQHTAADTKLANTLALRRGDLVAGWKVDPPAKPNPPCTAGPDESTLVQTAKVDPSFTWKDGVTNVGSEVDVFRVAADARRDWRLSTLALLETCLLQSARAGFGKSVRVRVVSAQALAAPKVAERALHYRFVLAIRTTQTRNLVIDIVALGRGRVTVVLHTLTVQTPLPAAVVSALTGVLAGRLSAGDSPTA
jgi:hypothetical protein